MGRAVVFTEIRLLVESCPLCLIYVGPISAIGVNSGVTRHVTQYYKKFYWGYLPQNCLLWLVWPRSARCLVCNLSESDKLHTKHRAELVRIRQKPVRVRPCGKWQAPPASTREWRPYYPLRRRRCGDL